MSSMVSRFDAPEIRRFLEGQGYPVDFDKLAVRPDQLPSTLCYLVVSDRLLMLRRKKEPFSGHWTAPGGKIRPGESPLDAIRREMKEETGLEIIEPRLKAVCSETGDTHYNWLLFIFRAHRYTGELVESDEGELRWLSLDDLEHQRLPDVDRRILRFVLDDAPEPYYFRVVYDEEHNVAELEQAPLASYCV